MEQRSSLRLNNLLLYGIKKEQQGSDQEILYHVMSMEQMTSCIPIAATEAMAAPSVFAMETTTTLYSL